MFVEWAGLDEYVESVGESGPAVMRAWKSTSRQASRLLEQAIEKRTPEASGALKGGIRVNAIHTHQGVGLDVVFTEEYWLYVEYGTSPHWPPPEAIEEWIRVKGIAGDATTISQLAFLIGRKIAREGTPARRMVSQAVEETRPTLERMYMKALDDVFTRNRS